MRVAVLKVAENAKYFTAALRYFSIRDTKVLTGLTALKPHTVTTVSNDAKEEFL